VWYLFFIENNYNQPAYLAIKINSKKSNKYPPPSKPLEQIPKLSYFNIREASKNFIENIVKPYNPNI